MSVTSPRANPARGRRHTPDATTVARRVARWGTGELDPALDAELDAYIDFCYANGETTATLRNKRVIVRQILVEYGDTDPVSCREYADAHGLAPGTVRGYMTTARGYARFLFDTGRRDVEPWQGFRMPRKSRPRPKPFAREEAERLIAESEGKYHEWFVLAYYAGLRAIEISRIRGDWLQETPHGWELFVHGKGNVQNSVPAHAKVVELLEGKPRGEVYPTVNADSVSTMSKHHLRKMGVPHGGIHRFRHTFGTELYNATGDIRLVQAMMRHESIESTLCYVALDDRKHRRALDTL